MGEEAASRDRRMTLEKPPTPPSCSVSINMKPGGPVVVEYEFEARRLPDESAEDCAVRWLVEQGAEKDEARRIVGRCGVEWTEGLGP